MKQTLVNVKTKRKIFSNFVCFLESLNFMCGSLKLQPFMFLLAHLCTLVV